MMNKKISGAFLYLQSLETVVVRSAAVLCDNVLGPKPWFSSRRCSDLGLGELSEHSEEKKNLSVAGFFIMIRVHSAVMKIFD